MWWLGKQQDKLSHRHNVWGSSQVRWRSPPREEYLSKPGVSSRRMKFLHSPSWEPGAQYETYWGVPKRPLRNLEGVVNDVGFAQKFSRVRTLTGIYIPARIETVPRRSPVYAYRRSLPDDWESRRRTLGQQLMLSSGEQHLLSPSEWECLFLERHLSAYPQGTLKRWSTYMCALSSHLRMSERGKSLAFQTSAKLPIPRLLLGYPKTLAGVWRPMQFRWGRGALPNLTCVVHHRRSLFPLWMMEGKIRIPCHLRSHKLSEMGVGAP